MSTAAVSSAFVSKLKDRKEGPSEPSRFDLKNHPAGLSKRANLLT